MSTGGAYDEADSASYLYIAICSLYTPDEERTAVLKNILAALSKYNISCTFDKPKYTAHTWGSTTYYSLDSGNIDHVDELKEWLRALLADEDKLLRYLSAGCVVTGNDKDNYIKDTVYNMESRGYEVYVKGN